jgi:hypothetical protein
MSGHNNNVNVSLVKFGRSPMGSSPVVLQTANARPVTITNNQQSINAITINGNQRQVRLGHVLGNWVTPTNRPSFNKFSQVHQ